MTDENRLRTDLYHATKALWDVRRLLGFDNDGDAEPHIGNSVKAYAAMIVDDVVTHREETEAELARCATEEKTTYERYVQVCAQVQAVEELCTQKERLGLLLPMVECRSIRVALREPESV